LERTLRQEGDLVHVIRRGFPIEVADHLVNRRRITIGDMDQLVLPRRTFAHRRKLGRLTAEQSDRLVRLARMIAATEEAFA
jgi:putative toxin-antitoxin system antitoxin component (TIGR02293 family)